MVGSRAGEAITAADADITRNTAAAVGRTILLAVDYVSLAGEDGIRRSEQLMPQLTLSPSSDRPTPIIFEVTRPGDPAPVARRQARIAETTAGVVVARDALPAATLPPGRYTMTAKIGDGSATLSRGFTVVAAGAGIAEMPPPVKHAPR